MSHFLVNGIERSCPVPEEKTFGDLLGYVQRTLNNDSSLISTIRVNGHDVSKNEESALSNTQISSIDRVEVVTVHPKELADETLQTLLPFTTHLEGLSRQAADRLGSTGSQPSSPLTRLIDGLITFSDAIASVKEIFGIGRIAPEVEASQQIEFRLLESLRELLECQRTRNQDRMGEILASELPAILSAWRETGIPALARAHDS